ncbi:unnamed protein product [Natator depressus]
MAAESSGEVLPGVQCLFTQEDTGVLTEPAGTGFSFLCTVHGVVQCCRNQELSNRRRWHDAALDGFQLHKVAICLLESKGGYSTDDADRVAHWHVKKEEPGKGIGITA